MRYRSQTSSAASLERVNEQGRPPAPPPVEPLRRLVAVDVLIDPARVRAAVAAPRGDYVALLVREGQLHAALRDVGVAGVRLARSLAWIGSGDGVAPVRPDAVREAADRGHPQVVTRERHRAVVELLVV